MKQVASELLANGVQHGAPVGKGTAVELEIRLERGEFALSVTNVPDLPRTWSTTSASGRGRRIVAEQSDSLTCTYRAVTALPA